MTVSSHHPEPYTIHTVQTSLSQLAQTSADPRQHINMAEKVNESRKQKNTNGKISNKNSTNPSKNSDTVFTHTLYLENLAPLVSEQDILEFIQSFEPIEVVLYHDPENPISGHIRFANEEQADRAFVLFNGTCLPHRSNAYITLKISDPNINAEPQAQAGYLQVKQLPLQVDTNYLYQLFRPFGPMAVCKLIVDNDGSPKGTAIIQYFRQQDADEALDQMHCKEIDNKSIVVSKYPVGKTKSSSAHPASVAPSVMPSATLSAPHKSLSPTAAPYTPPSSSISNTSAEEYVDPTTVLTATMDPCNLYIKNLDLNIKSSDLFNSFRKFGRIISARVMNNPVSGLSKGFGFVSFSKPEEASKALQEMNGKPILSKNIVVAYHEPKKARAEKSTQQFTANGNGGTASPPLSQGPVSPMGTNFLPHQQTDVQLGFNNQERARSLSTPVYMPQVQPADNILMPPFIPLPPPVTAVMEPKDFRSDLYLKVANATHASPAEIDKITTALIEMNKNDLKALSYPNVLKQKIDEIRLIFAPPQIQQTAVPSISVAEVPSPPAFASVTNYNLGRPTLRRRGSVESISSILTDTSAILQRKKMFESLSKIGETEYVEDIVDMLLTLKKKDLSLCIFNQDFLKEKVKLAKEALEIFGEDDAEYPLTPTPNTAAPPVPVAVSIVTPQTTPTPSPPAVVIQTTKSKAIPIIAPPSSTKTSAQLAQYTEIENFLKSFEDKPMHEKKQKLGDRLFPLVKATGIKQAPKVTIRLLDTIDLRELAHLMNDPIKLKEKVDAASASLNT